MPKYKSPTTAMKHQVEAGARRKLRPQRPSKEDVMAYLMEMGTGKTKVILDEWQEAVGAGYLQDMLVFGPAGSYRNWYEDKSDEQPSELRRHLDPALFERTVVAPWVSGGGAAVRQRIDRLMRERQRPRALFVNIEAMSTVEKAQTLCREFLEQRGRALIAVDESTTIKNPTSQRTGALRRIRELAPVRRIATGLVTPRSPLDLFSQFEFLDWRILGFESYFAFRAKYAIMQRKEFGGRKFSIVVGYRNVEELQQRIAPYSYRVLKDQCLDLEPKTYAVREVELTDEQRRMYREIKEFATTMVGDDQHVVVNAVIAQILRLHQITLGHVRDENKVEHTIKSNRTKAVMELLGEHGGKAVIWVNYHHTLNQIVEAITNEYGPEAVAQYHGNNTGTRGAEERRFLGDPACRFMVATYAGAFGNTWVCADLVIYASNSYDLELRSQSEDRTHRKGQTKKVLYVDIIARGTVEEKIVRSLRNKIDMATAISGDGYKEWLI
jgi:SNF2 family DNA or RNA helicase